MKIVARYRSKSAQFELSPSATIADLEDALHTYFGVRPSKLCGLRRLSSRHSSSNQITSSTPLSELRLTRSKALGEHIKVLMMASSVDELEQVESTRVAVQLQLEEEAREEAMRQQRCELARREVEERRKREADEAARKHMEALESARRIRELHRRVMESAEQMPDSNASIELGASVFCSADLFGSDGVVVGGAVNRVVLDEATLRRVIDRRVPLPLVFRVVADADGESGAVHHVSVHEFSAPHGTCLMGAQLMRTLGLADGDDVSLRSIGFVPKCTHVALRPHRFDWLLLDTRAREALLEQQLRNYAVVTLNDTVAIEHAGHFYRFDIAKIEPSDASVVSLLDVDVAVDVLEPLQPMPADIEQLQLGKSLRLRFDDKRTATFVVPIANAAAAPFEFRFEPAPSGINFSVYAATNEMRPTREHSQWLAASISSRVGNVKLAFDATRESNLVVAAHYFVTVECDQLGGEIVVSTSTSSSNTSSSDGAASSSSSSAICSLCSQSVPRRNLTMHQAHCQRYTEACPTCGERVRDMDAHRALHDKVECHQCKAHIEERDLSAHRRHRCPLRSVTCRFCALTMPLADRQEHERACGSQSARCQLCDAYRGLRSAVVDHIVTSHVAELQSEASATQYVVPD
jgi:Ubiquitin fusion degradation protein UFD1